MGGMAAAIAPAFAILSATYPILLAIMFFIQKLYLQIF